VVETPGGTAPSPSEAATLAAKPSAPKGEDLVPPDIVAKEINAEDAGKKPDVSCMAILTGILDDAKAIGKGWGLTLGTRKLMTFHKTGGRRAMGMIGCRVRIYYSEKTGREKYDRAEWIELEVADE
jgi:hypothetical protein